MLAKQRDYRPICILIFPNLLICGVFYNKKNKILGPKIVNITLYYIGWFKNRPEVLYSSFHCKFIMRVKSPDSNCVNLEIWFEIFQISSTLHLMKSKSRFVIKITNINTYSAID